MYFVAHASVRASDAMMAVYTRDLDLSRGAQPLSLESGFRDER